VARVFARRRRLSIGARWVLLYTAATSILLLLLSGLIYNRITSLVLDGVDQDLHQYIHRINETIARIPADQASLATSIETIIASSSVAHELAIELYDEKLQLVVQRDILAPFPGSLRGADLDRTIGVLAYQEVRDAEYPYFVRVEANGSGFTRAAIYGGTALGELKAIRNVLSYVLVVGSMLAGIVGWWLARQTLRSIKDVNETAKRVSLLGNESWIPTQGTGDELDDLVETLNRMRERVRHSTDQMRRFAAQAAHELLTPLGVARTRIEVTLAEEKGECAYRNALVEVLADVESLGTTVNAVLDIARSGGGLDAEQLQEIDLDKLLLDIAEFYDALAEDRGIDLKTPLQLHTVVFGDPIWVNRLFSNLVDNAIKFSPDGGRVLVSVASCEEGWQLRVDDNGPGVPLGDRQAVFEKFNQLRDHLTEKPAGTGIGLAASRAIVAHFGGLVWCENSPIGGARFVVLLPGQGHPRLSSLRTAVIPVREAAPLPAHPCG